MSSRTLLLDRAAKSLIFSLVLVPICTAASAQTPFAGSPYANRPAIRAYASPWQSYNRYPTPQPGYGTFSRPGGSPMGSAPATAYNPFAGGAYANRPAIRAYASPWQSYNLAIAESDGGSPDW
jgi:hypothetical protein